MIDINDNINNGGGEVDIENRIIYLHSDSPGDDLIEPGVDYRMANTFIKNLDKLSKTEEPIIIKMGTMGGEWNYGMAIYDAIKTCRCHTTIIAFAWARSMGSIILQAANERIMMPHCDFMIHFGSMAMDDSTLNVISDSNFSKNQNKVMLDIYAESCKNGEFFLKNKKVKNIQNFLKKKMEQNGNWWLNSSETVYYGFADTVFSL